MRDGKLTGKYYVERVDGVVKPDARYFVMDYANDPFARTAIRAYAKACAETHPTLAADLIAVADWYDERDNQRRRDSSKPARGRQGAGGEQASAEGLAAMLARRSERDPEFAEHLRALLDDTDQ